MSDTPNRDVVFFTEALRLPLDERADYLEQACGSDRELRQRVEALLEAHESAGDFLEQPPQSAALEARIGTTIGEKPGDRIGRYKLLQQIGEGGCGVVYMAEQEEPVRRRVALKIIKPGMDSRSVIARFEAERQALALMDHPSIAKVFDAGATESGRPYFVMELVRGTKITDYCDQNELNTEERLRLFIQICRAVQHAHQKGVIHRDIKPSNILVTAALDGGAQPMVIDFGIAKATIDQRLTDKTLFTAFEMLIGTPAYMSPEQTALTSVDVDTRTDIYSLGVLLYELLTGSTPFDTTELLKAGLDEVRRVIREQEPVRPSARLSRLTPPDLTSVARRRQAEPPALIRVVRGDLDWIVIKALEKDRTRRYETANGLALDVQRVLANEVITARPPSASYRLQKAIARNRLLFGAIAVIAALLVGALVVISASLAKERQTRREADAARKLAETEKASAQTAAIKSDQITRFLEDMLQGVGPSVALGRDTAMLREILDKASARISTELNEQPATRAELQNKIGVVYEQLALYNKAEALQRDAVAGFRKLHGDDHAQVAAALGDLASVLLASDKLSDAENAYREVLKIRRRLFSEENPMIARSMANLAKVLRNEGKLEEADATLVEALRLQRKLLGNDSLEVADTLYTLGLIRSRHARSTEARVLQREALDIRTKLLGREHPAVADSLEELGSIEAILANSVEAQKLLAESLAINRKVFGDRHPRVAHSLVALGRSMAAFEKPAEAEPLLREALGIQQAVLGASHQETLITCGDLGRVLTAQGKNVEAEAIYRDALARGRRALGDTHVQVATLLSRLAIVLLIEHKPAEAESLYAEFLPPGRDRTPGEVYLLRYRTLFFGQLQRWREAIVDAEWVVRFRPTDYMSQHLLAPLLARVNDGAAYERVCRDIIDQYGRTDNPFIAERMAKDCMLLPAPGIDLAAVATMADTAVAKGEQLEVKAFFYVCKSLAEYRRGNFDSAIKFSDTALHSGSYPYPGVQGMAYPLLAMSHHRLGHVAEARRNFELAAAEQQKDWPDNQNLGESWQTWIFVHELFAEAGALIEK